MHFFYTPDLNNNSEYTLSEEESKHCTRVLRLGIGDVIHLVNGKGKLYKATITNNHEKKCTVNINQVITDENNKTNYLHIAIAPTKNIERLEWFLEKATEIGIDEITTIICERSERTTVKTERLNKVIVGAMKQSYKLWLPKLNEAIKLNDFLKNDFEGDKFIAHCNNLQYNTNSTTNFLKNNYQKGNKATILIGPEGDFTEQEVTQAISKGYKETTLSNSRLRTETAGIVACDTFNLINS